MLTPSMAKKAESKRLVFGAPDVDNVLSQMSSEEVEQLPVGVIKIDAKGKILIYNAAEGALAGLSPRDVIGRNFFRDIAPCTNRPEFLGRFVDGVKSGNLDVIFEYRFFFNRIPTRVTVQMRRSYHDQSFWILIQERSDISANEAEISEMDPSKKIW
jgi:photoactive yellow protein